MISLSGSTIVNLERGKDCISVVLYHFCDQVRDFVELEKAHVAHCKKSIIDKINTMVDSHVSHDASAVSNAENLTLNCITI